MLNTNPVLSTHCLLTLLPSAKPARDPNNQEVENCKERIDYLICTLTKSKTSILITTPVFAEYLVGVGPNKNEFVEKIIKNKVF